MQVRGVNIDTRKVEGGTEVLLEIDAFDNGRRGLLRELVTLPDCEATDLLLHHIGRLRK